VKFVPTDLAGVFVIEPEVHRDSRGFFLETYHARKFAAAGIGEAFVQDNHSLSLRNSVRGLHAQSRNPQAKLVRCARGTIYDVAVDIRLGSATFGRYVAVQLSGEDFRELFLPPGFAHGFAVLSDEAEVEYKCSACYDPDDEISIAWNDPDIGIPWPVESPLLSPKDQRAPRLAEIHARLPRYAGTRA